MDSHTDSSFDNELSGKIIIMVLGPKFRFKVSSKSRESLQSISVSRQVKFADRAIMKAVFYSIQNITMKDKASDEWDNNHVSRI